MIALHPSDVGCPVCDAPAGECCVGALSGADWHIARVNEVIAVMAPDVLPLTGDPSDFVF